MADYQQKYKKYFKAKVSVTDTDVLGEVGSAGKHNYEKGP